MSDAPQPTSPVSRREFLAAGAGAMALPLVELGERADEKPVAHHIPADKHLDPAWVKQLFAKGEPKVYRGDELTCVGMPVGGICAGQLYLCGDGTLAGWDIFNVDHFTGYGDRCYRTYAPPKPLQQGFAVWAKAADGEPIFRTLDKTGFPQVEFCGEYPIGTVRYVRAADDPLPLDVTLEAFSPFVPLNARESGLPATVLRFRVKNTHGQPVETGLLGWLQNVVGTHHVGRVEAVGRNTTSLSKGWASIVLSVKEQPAARQDQVQPPEVFADFESGSYGDWKRTGECFGDKPATGTLKNQQKVSGYGGKHLVNTFVGGDNTTGTLTSPEFTVRRRYIFFRIGGGNQAGKTCMNLKVAGRVVRTATGKNNEKLEWDYWQVSDFKGQKAQIEIVDRATGGWGHINVDDITFADAPPAGAKLVRLQDQPDYGSLALSVLDEHATGSADGWERFRSDGKLHAPDSKEFSLGQDLTGALAAHFTLKPGETREVVFLVTWCFPGGEHGRNYGQFFPGALEVASYLRKHLDRLTKLTHLFHDTYYDSTLPRWLLDRLLMPVSTLATGTVQWWKNGRFWAWEGVGCCHGTCTHVWNYAQAVAFLFPELERSARTMQDLGPALDPKTGRVAFRGEGPGFAYAADGQCGTVLKCYREHLLSKDGSFLKENWPRIKKVMAYAIVRDGNGDGVIEDNQHNTYDIDFVGPNTFVGALYLAALQAAAKMADLQGDKEFADYCRAAADKGSRWTLANLWSGEYFVQRIPAGKATRFQYGDGCLADQLFGQNWAHRLGLGYLYPADKVKAALHSVYRYNWAPDVAAQNKAHPPERWFARPGEAGLFTCTWPKGGRMPEPVRYRDEIWTGIEYQVAANMIDEGLAEEALSIIRGVHDRYDGRKHNPWNEVECGDHYARALASWGCLLALAGYYYDGPAGRLGFAPRIQTDDFKVFFTAAEGWGSLRQTRREQAQVNGIEVRHGTVRVSELALAVPQGAKVARAKIRAGGQDLVSKIEHTGDRVTLKLNVPALLEPGRPLVVTLEW